MLSYHAIPAVATACSKGVFSCIFSTQPGQKERSRTTERSRGQRKIQTLRKLPISSPATRASTISITHPHFTEPSYEPVGPAILGCRRASARRVDVSHRSRRRLERRRQPRMAGPYSSPLSAHEPSFRVLHEIVKRRHVGD